MVFQSYNLWPHMTIYENLAFGLKLRKIPKKEIDAEIKKTLELVSMSGFEKNIRDSSPVVSSNESRLPAPCC